MMILLRISYKLALFKEILVNMDQVQTILPFEGDQQYAPGSLISFNDNETLHVRESLQDILRCLPDTWRA